MTPLECLGWSGYQARLIFYTVIPIIIAAIVLMVVTLRRLLVGDRLSMAAVLQAAAPLLLKLAFLAYPMVTNVAFEAFPCHKFNVGGAQQQQWLKADVSIECGKHAHHNVIALAWLAIGLYPVGLLVLTGTLLCCARSAIASRRATPLSTAIAFLHREYEPHMWWWELIEMFRRLLLVGLMQIMVTSGSTLQIILGTVFCVTFLLFQVQAGPYISLYDDLLSNACSFSLTAVFLLSVAFKYDRALRHDPCAYPPPVYAQSPAFAASSRLSVASLIAGTPRSPTLSTFATR